MREKKTLTRRDILPAPRSRWGACICRVSTHHKADLRCPGVPKVACRQGIGKFGNGDGTEECDKGKHHVQQSFLGESRHLCEIYRVHTICCACHLGVRYMCLLAPTGSKHRVFRPQHCEMPRMRTTVCSRSFMDQVHPADRHTDSKHWARRKLHAREIALPLQPTGSIALGCPDHCRYASAKKPAKDRSLCRLP